MAQAAEGPTHAPTAMVASANMAVLATRRARVGQGRRALRATDLCRSAGGVRVSEGSELAHGASQLAAYRCPARWDEALTRSSSSPSLVASTRGQRTLEELLGQLSGQVVPCTSVQHDAHALDGNIRRGLPEALDGGALQVLHVEGGHVRFAPLQAQGGAAASTVGRQAGRRA